MPLTRHIYIYLRNTSLGLLSLCAVVACDSSQDKDVIEPGERIAIMFDNDELVADDALRYIFSEEPPIRPQKWHQSGGSASGVTGALDVTGANYHDSARIGDGNIFKRALAPAPVATDAAIFAMDASGAVSAHSIAEIDDVLWRSEAGVIEDRKTLIGGGLALDSQRLYVATGFGTLMALNPADGQLLWRKEINIPLRSPPKTDGERVYVIAADNQLFAYNGTTGQLQWTHQGISESSGFLATASPAIIGSTLIVPHSSGELYALNARTGRPLWNDGLILPRRTRASALFSGIAADPIIADGSVYAVASNGLFVRNNLRDGRSIWQREISSLHRPWVSSDVVYMLSETLQLAAIQREDGRIIWASDVAANSEEMQDGETVKWLAPLRVRNQVWLINNQGEMLRFNAEDGAFIQNDNVPNGIISPPAVIGQTLYVITKNAELYALK